VMPDRTGYAVMRGTMFSEYSAFTTTRSGHFTRVTPLAVVPASCHLDRAYFMVEVLRA
jgi:hypothetical protein